MVTARGERHDRPRDLRSSSPGRRDRIIDAALDVIAADGVAGASHRRVAAAAGVPLGSMTYHFTGMNELLREAFTRFADRSADRFDALMQDAQTPTDALQVVADSITAGNGSEDLVRTHELYTLAARDPAFRDITECWMARTRAALEAHLDPLTARLLDAFIEGMTIHRALDRDPATAAQVTEGLRRIMRP